MLSGDTIHSCMHMHGEAGLDLETLSKGVTPELMDFWKDVKAALIDEVSLVPPRLLGAASYRMCLGRRGEADKYAERGHMFGGVPIVILLGDFLQLAPFEGKRRVSLLKAPIAGTADSRAEHMNGLRVFWEGITDVVFLDKTYRFVDRSVNPPRECQVLPRLFEYMRRPGGKRMPADLYAALKAREVKGARDPRLREEKFQGAYTMAVVWEAVARLMQYRAHGDAARAGKRLEYVQAIDVARSGSLPERELRRALQVCTTSRTNWWI